MDRNQVDRIILDLLGDCKEYDDFMETLVSIQHRKKVFNNYNLKKVSGIVRVIFEAGYRVADYILKENPLINP